MWRDEVPVHRGRRRFARANRRAAVARDFVAGWLDGRRGMPNAVATSRGLELVSSGHMLSISNRVGEGVDGIYVELLRSTEDDRVRLAQIQPTRERLAARLQDFMDRLDEESARGPQAGRRKGEQTIPDDLVRRRREAEHRRRLRYLRKEITETRHEMERLDTEREALEARIRSALVDAQARARQLIGTGDLRLASYIKGVCVSHPEPQSVVRAAAELRAAEPEWLELASATVFTIYSQEAAA